MMTVISTTTIKTTKPKRDKNFIIQKDKIRLLKVFLVVILIGIIIGHYYSSLFSSSLSSLLFMDYYRDDVVSSSLITAILSEEKNNKKEVTSYLPSSLEQYVIDNAERLGFADQDVTKRTKKRYSCELINNPSYSEIYHGIRYYIQQLEHYNDFVTHFTPMEDIRKQLIYHGKTLDTICPTLQPRRISGTTNEIGFATMFPNNSNYSSILSYSSRTGYMEPLLPPLRHLANCYNGTRNNLIRMDYMIHDFSILCQKIKVYSRIIFIDMGASLQFVSGDDDGLLQPATYITSLYHKFGFHFDHIYAYEITKQDPDTVFELVPHDMLPAYHWINVGVDPTKNSTRNPLHMLLNQYNEDDIIIIKLDIDTPSVEIPLVLQILDNTNISKLIDHFYFEHHVKLQELMNWWGDAGVSGTVYDSLRLFQILRRRGIASHSWV